MPTFTLPLNEVVRLTGGTSEIVNNRIKVTGANTGLEGFPIFDEAWRDTLTGNIYEYFWNQEIGQETIDLFRLSIRRKMNLIMPLYNKLYLSERVNYDPLSTIDIHTVSSNTGEQTGNSMTTGENSGTSNSANNSTGKSRAVNSDTPQTQLSGEEDYADSLADVISNSDGTSSGTQTENNESTSNAHNTSEQNGDNRTSGFVGVAANLITAYRNSLLNIDQMIIAELKPCFMLIWDTGDSYGNQRDADWGYASADEPRITSIVVQPVVEELQPDPDNPGYYS